MESTDSSSGPHHHHHLHQQHQQQQHPQLPPGFRFHPTDEELVVHYLKKKAASTPLPVTIIAEVDLYKFDPWELPGKASFGEHEWYFFSPRDRKYPNGARPNRAATSGYWKATGTDKPILTSRKQKVGVKKALVFYSGKPPKGIKTNWIMHEYRLADGTSPAATARPPRTVDLGSKKSSLRLDDWVLCRIYKKNNSQRAMEQDREEATYDGHGQLPTQSATFSTRLQQPHQITTAATNYTAMVDNEEAFFQELLNDDGSITQLAAAARVANSKPQSPKRALGSQPWTAEGMVAQPPAKRFQEESGTDSASANIINSNNRSSSSSANNERQRHTITTLLNQIPRTAAAYEHQNILGSLENGSTTVFRQPPFQISSMISWSS